MKRLDVLKALRRLRKPFYTLSDMQKILGVPRAQAKVEVFRLIRSGILERLATNVYVSPWMDPDIERVASQLHIPCYLSFESALSQWGIMSQIPYTLTFATLRKSKKLRLGNTSIEYRQIQPALWGRSKIIRGIPTAIPEKALIDQTYMTVLGKGRLELSELDLQSVSKSRLKGILRKIPVRLRRRMIAKLKTIL